MKISINNFKDIKLNISSFTDFKRRKAATKEPKTVEWLKNQIDQDNNLNFIDIGANVGGYSLIACNMSNGINCIAIEPFPPTFYSLAKNITLNNYEDRILPICAVVGKEIRPSNNNLNNCINFSFEKWSSGLAEHPDNSKNSFLSPTVDDLYLLSKINNNRSIIMKIDVDGAELNVLAAVQGILSKNNLKSILIECSISNSNTVKDILKMNKLSLIAEELKENNKEVNLIFEK